MKTKLNDSHDENKCALPGAELNAQKMPGHWLFARLGKRVLRPGGLELTKCMLKSLAIGESDSVVEFAPGLGITSRLALEKHPSSYIGIEGNEAAAVQVRHYLSGPNQKCLVGRAGESSLQESSATVVYGEAMLTMQGASQKLLIVREAYRVLKPGGRYGIHEMCLVPDNLDVGIKQEIQHVLSDSIHVGTKPLTAKEWRTLLEEEGFEIKEQEQRPMRLLEPGRLIQDEGLGGALRFLWNLWRETKARRRVLDMRRTFSKYRSHIRAIMLIGIKRS